MARRGRKRKPGKRVNGRLVQPTQSERLADVKSVVLNQPHRRGDESQMRENAIGRMIKDCWDKDWWPDKHDQPDWSPQDLYTASQKYADAWAGVQMVMSSERPLANEARRGSGVEMTEEEIAEWRDRKIRAWSDISNSIGGKDSLYRKAADIVIIDNPGDDWTAPFWVKHGVKMALVSLAEHCLGGKRRAA